ncbi:hypothetical protein [Paenibacillus sp. S-12]|uniref:hypothetical protein n=1 Tax=Paenibacillus sp. S-12 TaxID=3031371 RepID=UPI0025A1BCD5|nr:hypothetical protein [Paenibacillus sp. S-12]
MKKYFIKHAWWLSFVSSFFLLVAHTFSLPNFKIDNITIIFLAIMMLSPYISNLKRIKVGDFEAEIHPKEVEKVKDEINKSMHDDAIDFEIEPSIELLNTIESIEDLAEHDHILALAKVRIELEKLVNKLYGFSNPGTSKLPLGRLIYELSSQGVLPEKILSPLKEVISLCNRAIHSEEVRKPDAISIIDMGTWLMRVLSIFIQDYSMEPSEVIEISEDELNQFEQAKFKVVTIVPIIDNPIKNIYFVSQEGLDRLLEGYDEYAEFVVEISKVNT